MPLTHTRELFAKALKGKYALGAFNVNNMELLQAIVEACEEEKAPVMLQISKGARLRQSRLSQKTDRGRRQPHHHPHRRPPRPRRFLRTLQGMHR
jgi:hypothetical protein